MLIDRALEVVDGYFVNEYADWWIPSANDILHTAYEHRIVHLDKLYNLPYKAVKVINTIIDDKFYEIEYI